MDINCKKCKGTGWVCESHPDVVWEDVGGCNCGGAGSPCSCNSSGELPFDTIVIASIDKPDTQH